MLLHQQSPKSFDEQKAEEADLPSAENTRREGAVSPHFTITIIKPLPGTGQQHKCSQVYHEFSFPLLREQSHKGESETCEWVRIQFLQAVLGWGSHGIIFLIYPHTGSSILHSPWRSGDVSCLSQTLSRAVKKQRLLFPCQQRVTEDDKCNLQVQFFLPLAQFYCISLVQSHFPFKGHPFLSGDSWQLSLP